MSVARRQAGHLVSFQPNARSLATAPLSRLMWMTWRLFMLLQRAPPRVSAPFCPMDRQRAELFATTFSFLCHTHWHLPNCECATFHRRWHPSYPWPFYLMAGSALPHAPFSMALHLTIGVSQRTRDTLRTLDVFFILTCGGAHEKRPQLSSAL